MKRVLVVIDMQNDFVTGPLGTPEARAAEPRICAKIEGFDGEIFYTLDSHTERYADTQEGRRLPIPHCILETEGWLPTAPVWAALSARGVADETHLLAKGTFGDLDLPERIRERFSGEPDEIVLVGVCTDICVICNAMLLKAALPETRIVVDAACCAGTSPAAHETALAAMRPCQIDIENA